MGDRIKDILNTKLNGRETPPPEQAWEKISAALSEQRRIEVFGPLSEPTVRIRRPSRRKMRWSAVASCAALIALIISITALLNRVEPEPGGDLTQPMAEKFEIVPQQSDEIKELPLPVAVETAVRAPRLAYNHRELLPKQKIEETHSHEQLSSTPVDEPEQIQQDHNKTERTEQTVTQKEEVGSARHITAAVMDSLRRAEMKKKRTNTGALSTSLFASNSLGSNNQINGSVTQISIPSGYFDQTDFDPKKMLAPVNRHTVNLKHKFPVTVGVNVSVPITGRWSVQTGLLYTFLRSESSARDSYSQADAEQKLHYLGIPVGLKYDLLQSRRFNLYGSAGATIEKCVSGNIWVTEFYTEQEVSREKYGSRGKGLQTSAQLAVGAEYKITSLLGFYIEPGLSYYFENSKQPDSYRTEHPWSFTAKAGFRFTLGN